MSNPFKIGDKVRFVDNELNRAEISNMFMKVTFTIGSVHECAVRIDNSDGRYGLYWYCNRFELVPQYAVGGYVMYENEYCVIVQKHKRSDTYDIYRLRRLRDGNHYSWITDDRMPIVSPFEVIVDFGNGIKGTIRLLEQELIGVEDNNKRRIANIWIHYLTDPMKTIVQDLLAAQAKEGK